MSIRPIQRATLHTWLTQAGLGPADRELAVLDVRDAAAFGNGAPLYATNLPLARLADEVARYVPRRSVRVVLVDGGDAADGEGEAAQAARRLAALGYTDLYVLAGGTRAWAAGDALGQPTVDIPGNIFAGGIRDLRATPSIDAAQLHALREAGGNVVVIDTRTPAEFADAHVPGALNAPGEEILQRFRDAVPDPDAFVVVSCAGLPRAIIGAQTLIDAGVPNRVALLEDGTVGWTRAAFALEQGADASRRRASDASVAYALDRVAQLGERVPVREIDAAVLAAWRAEPTRTTYLLDVRSREEYDAGHADGAISAPGGQLLGVTYRTLATRGARVVLTDDDGTRARTTAYWLRQRGWDVAVLAGRDLDRDSSSQKYAHAN
ncbi:rhodanese-like domain-containing protein [Burkholderia gladioli]|uniref:rhodanese-like domain-containing protein n=1 Tax=Burkholderia gladioli TaxID=28095 RepID=UPI00264A8109|nr:rhodanese-like domain-containing protein [Burkholderia gladioli]MDN7804553.1 rhodanese-like domain-containing protein [Burkholderia gladioli]